MATRQIEQSNWVEFFNQFSKDNTGKMATLREEGPDVGAQQDGTQRAFAGISADYKGSAAGSITIMMGTELDDNFERLIAAPTTVYVREAEGSGAPAVEIEQNDGPKTILDFQAGASQVGA